jgi:lipid II:glycine glycyltransferase (peptidoglycan interpeptide bridge formation enzyme)
LLAQEVINLDEHLKELQDEKLQLEREMGEVEASLESAKYMSDKKI